MVTEKTPIGTVIVPVDPKYRDFELLYDGVGHTGNGKYDESGFEAVVLKDYSLENCGRTYSYSRGQAHNGCRSDYRCKHLKFQAQKIWQAHKKQSRRLRLRCLAKLKQRKRS